MERIKNYIIELLGGCPLHVLTECAAEQFKMGFDAGKSEAKIHFRVLPLPFTEQQLRGDSYGEFITPVGFATPFGECSIPAPGQHGYEQRAYYVDKAALVTTGDLMCHRAEKFDKPADSDALVPVIVTVLR